LFGARPTSVNSGSPSALRAAPTGSQNARYGQRLPPGLPDFFAAASLAWLAARITVLANLDSAPSALRVPSKAIAAEPLSVSTNASKSSRPLIRHSTCARDDGRPNVLAVS